MPLIYEEYTNILRRAFYDVHNEVGIGRKEEAYHQALKLWFSENSLPIRSRVPHRLFLQGVEAYVLIPDFVGWDALSIEIKAVPRKLTLADWVQVRDYMKYRGESLGLLVNFGLDRVHVERVVHTPKENSIIEDWSYWDRQGLKVDYEICKAACNAIRQIYQEHSTGYGLEVVSRLIHCALKLQQLSVKPNPIVKSLFREQVVDESPLDCLVVNDRLLITFTALFDSNEFNVSRGLSFMKTLGLKWGVAANFGREKVELRGLRG